MRSVFTLCLLLACHLTAIAADPAADTFQVTNYKLAFVNVTEDGAVTNEYVPRGETLESWTSLIGVRQWTQTDKLADITGPYVKALQPLLVRDAKVYQPAGDTEETNVIFELYLAPTDKSYLEYNLIRFTREEGTPGVKSYQYALKGEYNLDAAVAANAPQLKSRLDVLGGLKLDAFHEMNETTPGSSDITPTATTSSSTKTRTTSKSTKLYPTDSIQVIEESVVQETTVEENTVSEQAAVMVEEESTSSASSSESEEDSEVADDDDSDADTDEDDEEAADDSSDESDDEDDSDNDESDDEESDDEESDDDDSDDSDEDDSEDDASEDDESGDEE